MVSEDHTLGAFLRSRRERLDPETFGFESRRRRTPGLRREEVAQRAGLSVTWYTWLEQERGGSPSVEALEALAEALVLTEAERAHLFHLALNHAPTVIEPASWRVTAHVQHILDALIDCPAFIKTPLWDVVAWNQAANCVLTDYGALAPHERNIMRLLFSDSTIRATETEQWQYHARRVVEAFRLETQRAGMSTQAEALIHDLSTSSEAFASMWSDQDVRSHGTGTKRLERMNVGTIVLDYASFSLDEQPGLGLVIYTPRHAEDRERVRALIASSC